MSFWGMFDKMLAEAQVVINLGSGFGSAGECSFRISAFNSRADVEEVCKRLKALVVSWKGEFVPLGGIGTSAQGRNEFRAPLKALGSAE